MLLATPLEQYQVEAIKRFSDYTFRPGCIDKQFTGMLAKLIDSSSSS
jgi:hypothetical protein